MANPSILPGYIGRFRVIRQLGNGAQGVVYLAADTRLERHVAIKTLHIAKDNPKIKDQLIKEALTVSKLQHPNIVTLYEAGEHAGKPFLVFELVDGISLREHLKKHNKLSAKDSLHILQDVLSGIAYAHQCGVIHRDLNPLNIMLANSQKTRIMDFGIATLLGKRDDDGVWGTLRYMSPEQCENKAVTAASDIFSLGLILYEMLTGNPFAMADNKFAIMNKILNEDVTIPDNIDPALHLILKKALAKDPAARYADALDMQQDLIQHLENIAPAISQSAANDSHGSTLQFLLRRMELKKDFPTLSHQIVEISQKAKAGGEFSTNALTNAILKDYSLSTKLLRLVNSPIYGQYGGHISTISRAVTILGFEEVRNAALGLMLIDHLKDKNQASALREASITSLMSGNIAHGLAQKMKVRDSEEAYVCSMFHNLGRLLSIYYFPEEMEAISDLIKRKNMKEEHAAKAVLGVGFDEIGIAVGESWQLPSSIIDSMHTLPAGELKKPLSQSDVLKHVTGFSNEYCELINNTGTHDRQQSFENLASRYSNTMSISRGQMEEILGHAMEEMEKYAQLVNLDLKTSPIFKKADNWSEHPADITTPSTNDVTESGKSEDAQRQENMMQSIQEITDAIVEGASINNVLLMVMETIFRSYSFQRVMFCLINKSRTSLNARFGFGKDIEVLIERLSIPLGGDKDIFNISLKQCRDMIVEDVDAKICHDYLPKWYRDDFAGTSMLVYPIVVKNVPMGLLYMDSITPVTLAEDSRYSLIKTLRNQIVLTIRQGANNK
jgi:eukaryotic-like serine/threonine-protein kinase